MGNVYIADLPLGVTEDQLQSIFSQYGTVVWHKILTAIPGKEDQAAIVEFGDISEAQWVVENINGNMPEGLSTPLTITFKKQKQSFGKGGGGWGKSDGKDWGKSGKGKSKGGY